MTQIEALAALLADLYSQVAALQARNAELEAKLAEEPKKASDPSTQVPGP